MPDAPPDAQTLFCRFLRYDGARRIPAADALRDPYLHNRPLPAR